MARPRGAKARAEIVRERLALEYPEAICALIHDDAFQLLTATILSAQTTDENVNKVTPTLFARYPTPADLAHADPDDVERLVFQTGFYRSKTKSLLGMARMLEEDFDGEVPTELDLNVLVPPEERGRFSLRLILHGRRVCFARKPNCGACVLVDICPSAYPAER